MIQKSKSLKYEPSPEPNPEPWSLEQAEVGEGGELCFSLMDYNLAGS